MKDSEKAARIATLASRASHYLGVAEDPTGLSKGLVETITCSAMEDLRAAANAIDELMKEHLS